jgi:hypothetical protein
MSVDGQPRKVKLLFVPELRFLKRMALEDQESSRISGLAPNNVVSWTPVRSELNFVAPRLWGPSGCDKGKDPDAFDRFSPALPASASRSQNDRRASA